MRRTLTLIVFAALPAFAADLKIDQVLQVTHNNSQVFLKNISDRIITAYDYQVNYRYPDGRLHPAHEGVDELSLLVNETVAIRLGTTRSASASASNQEAVFRPGVTKTITIGKQTINGAAPVAMEGVDITMVTLDDGTVVGNAGSAKSGRQQQVEMLTAILADLKEAQSATSPSQRAQELLSAREKTGKRNDGHASLLRMITTGAPNDKAMADRIVTVYQALLEANQEHLKLLVAKLAAPAK